MAACMMCGEVYSDLRNLSKRQKREWRAGLHRDVEGTVASAICIACVEASVWAVDGVYEPEPPRKARR